MEALLLITIGLYLVALISLLLVVRQYSKTEINQDPVPHDDAPARYEDYEEIFYDPEI